MLAGGSEAALVFSTAVPTPIPSTCIGATLLQIKPPETEVVEIDGSKRSQFVSYDSVR